jgi:hypothetical protein
VRAQAEPEEGSGQVAVRQGAPWAKLANEKPKGETIPYDKLLQAWKDGASADAA